MSNKRIRRIGRILRRILAVLLTLILLLVIAVHLPFVQRWIGGQAAALLEDTLETEVSLDRVSIALPSRVGLHNLVIKDQSGHELATLEKMRVGISLFGLLRSRLRVGSVAIEGVGANLVATADSSNFQFVLDALMPVEADSSQLEVPTDTATARPWIIDLSDSRLTLSELDIYYQDDPAGVLADLQLQQLDLTTDTIDLDIQTYQLDELEIVGLDMLYRQNESTDSASTSGPMPNMRFELDDLSLDAVSVLAEIGNMEIGAEVDLCTSAGVDIQLGGSLAAAIDEFDLRKSNILYRQRAIAPVDGLDPNHLDLQELTAAISDFELIDDSLVLLVEEVHGLEAHSGLRVTEGHAYVQVSPNEAHIDQALLQTESSRIAIEQTDIDLNSLNDLDRMSLALFAEGRLAVADMARIQPSIVDQLKLGRLRSAGFDFEAQARSRAGQLQLDQLFIQGPGIDIEGSGAAHRLASLESLTADFQLDRLSIQPKRFLPLLPRGLLPAYIQWPDRIEGQGRGRYYAGELVLDLGLRENRAQADRWTQLVVDGRMGHPLDFPDSRLALRIDSIVATRATALAYLPPSIIPEGYRLPDYAVLSGQVNGPIDSLSIDLDLKLPTTGSHARIAGSVTHIMQAEQLRLDLQLNDLLVDPDGVLPLLPDSLLPEYIEPPELRISQGLLAGGLDDLTFRIPMQAGRADWLLQGRYDPHELAVELVVQHLQPAELFRGDVRDSILALNLQPIDVQATLSGHLEPELSLQATTEVHEQGRGRIVQLVGDMTNSRYQAEFVLEHPDLLAAGELSFSPADSLSGHPAASQAMIHVERLDLQRWQLAENKLTVAGRISADVEGLDLSDLQADVHLDEVVLRDAEGSSYIDSMRIQAALDQGDNELLINSDFMNAEVEGYFDPIALPLELSRFLQGYVDQTIVQPEPVENGRRFNARLAVTNPRPLVSGIIPGLTELSPLTAELTYREQSPDLLISLQMDKLTYLDFQLRNTRIEGRGSTDSLRVSGQWSNISYGNGLELGPTQLNIHTQETGITAELRVASERDSLYHHLRTSLLMIGERMEIRLHDQQRINGYSWQLPPDNLLALDGQQIEVHNWQLERDGSYLRLRESEQQGLRIDFNDFQLETLSGIANTEEELAAGLVNGTAYIDHILSKPGVRAQLQIDQLVLLESPFGDLDADISSLGTNSWQIDVGLSGPTNELQLNGSYSAGGAMELQLDVERFALSTLEPFSLGYLDRTDGYLDGRLDIGGSIEAPRLDGQLQFNESAFAVSILGSRLRVDDQRVTFDDRRISFDQFTLVDSLGNEAVADGRLTLRSLADIGVDMQVRADDFLVLNSTAADNDLFYGYLLVDADVQIRGTLQEPELEVDAGAVGNSRLTYAYTAPTGFAGSADGVVTFAEIYEWEGILSGSTPDTLEREASGTFMRINLEIDDNLLVRAIIDPATRQEFSGRGEGDITFIQYPNGRQEMTGRVDMVEGTYDMVLQGLRPFEFKLRPSSYVTFEGNPGNPRLHLDIFSPVTTSPLPLIQTFNPSASQQDVRGRETFEVDMSIDGDLTQMDVQAQVLYPDNNYGNQGLSSIKDALSVLRQDQSRMYTTAITLITFGGFNIPLIESGSSGNDAIANGVADAVANQLSNFLNQQLGFVDVELGIENYGSAGGHENNYNLSVSLSRSFMDDRLIVSIDGVTNTSTDASTGTSQTYLDNISVEYLIDADGDLRIKLFNDRQLNVLVGGNVVRFGGRLVFSKDFNRFFWEPKTNGR